MKGTVALLSYYITATWIYTTANIVASFQYKRKYLKGRYFSSPGASGWKYIRYYFRFQKFHGLNSNVPWPVTPSVKVAGWENIDFDLDDMQIFWTGGTYFQAIDARIIIGKGTWIAPNVGLITTNHDIYNPDFHTTGKDIALGEKCWIGMNAVILPGVILGPNTTVGAGAVVTKSFPEGYCVIVGNPAKKIKDIEIKNVYI